MAPKPRRYLIVHGHFYQPPRENPWLGEVQPEPSAAPFRDWNVRIARECYGPNGLARIVDDENRVVAMNNNYASMSFNFGPTLFRWLERHEPEIMASVLEGDRASLERTGFGNALAHPFDHVILPLATRRDKETLVRWGIEEFSRRYGRRPLGMWLPETAADIETLEVLAAHGIEFTVLAPRQARRTRPFHSPTWCEVDSATLDTSLPYLQRLPGGKSIVVFFFHGPLSHRISFEQGFKNAPGLLEEIKAQADRSREKGPGLVVLATDGETLGHHFKFGDMGLAALFRLAESTGSFEVTNFARFLSERPVRWEVEIADKTSWSCGHGVERWRSDCGCRLGGPENHQKWRGPLRESLNNLAGKIDGLYEKTLQPLVENPWAARDDYIDVVLDDSGAARERFVSKVSRKPLSEDEAKTLFRTLEMACSRLAMFTSCGWFFDEVSGLETVLILTFAARAMDLAGMLGEELEEDFLHDLARAPSNKKRYRDGGAVYREKVAPLRPVGTVLAAAWGLRRLLGLGFSSPAFYVEEDTGLVERAGTAMLGGRVDLFFHRILKRQSVVVLAALPEGEEPVLMAKGFEPGEDVAAPAGELSRLVSQADLSAAVGLFESLPNARKVPLKSLPPSGLVGLLNADARLVKRGLYGLVPASKLGPGAMAQLFELDPAPPQWLREFYGLLLDLRLSEELKELAAGGDPGPCLNLLSLMKELNHSLDPCLAGDAILKAFKGLIRRPRDASVATIDALFEVARSVGGLDLWPVENLFYRTYIPGPGGGLGQEERDAIRRLGELLGFTDELLKGLG